MYDYLIVGSGFFGSTFARLATDDGKKCLVLEERKHVGGNAYDEKREGIYVHVYGPHIFHTNDEKLWKFVNRFSSFNNFISMPKSYRDGRMYSLPFNMNTFYEIWGCTKPEEAKKIIESQKFLGNPQNLEEQALRLVGRDIYELLIKDYTKKQWQKDPKDLPSFIIKRLPVRYTYDSRYFDDKFQGIPENGYTEMIKNMLDGIEVLTNTNYFYNKKYFDSICKNVVFTGKIDEYYDYEYGQLEYRTLEFINETLEMENFQGNAVINYPDLSVPWTRIVEHKHFTNSKSDVTIITKEIPSTWSKGTIPYYPINDNKNQKIFDQYYEKSLLEKNVIFGGRLSEYRYYDMHQVIASAMSKYKKIKECRT